MADPGAATLQHLAETHFTTAEPLKETVYNTGITKTRDEINRWNPKWIIISLVKLALKQFHNKKSPGPDGLKPLILKHLTDHAYKTLLFIYKSCLLLTFTPTAWKGCRIIFIPKPGKSTYKLAKSWRPISLTNYMLKGLERLCGWHMDEQLKKFPVHTKQHGFRTDRNTETAISEAVNYIEKHVMNNQHTVGVFLDIQAAFDTISPKKIKESLLKHGGDPIMVGWYDSYITHRNIFININGENLSLLASAGFPQGGVCSAKFWIIAYNDALLILNKHGVLGICFADDSLALRGGNKLHQIMSRLQKVVSELEKWGITCGLKFNASKTEVVIFTKSNIKQKDMPKKLQVSGQEVEFNSCAKYLGVTLDNKLNWNTHFFNQTTKCKRYLFTIKKSVSKAWGPKPTYIRWIYTAVVRPRLCYGAVAWGHSTRLETRKDQLDKLNRLAATMITPVRRSTQSKQWRLYMT